MEILTALLASLLYLAAILQIIPGLSSNNQISAKPVFFTALAALALHAYLLKDLILSGSGQNLSMLNVASLVSFIIAMMTTGLIFRLRLWFLLPVVYAFAGLNLASATLLPGAFITHLESHPEVLLHISLALFSYSTLMIATLYALQLAWLDYQLKHKKRQVINHNVPPLMMVERQLFNIILVGQVLLTLTLISGFVFVDDMFAQGKAHKAFLSMAAWGVYGVLLWGHYQSGWRGRRVVWFSIVGAFLLTLAYFGSRFVREILIAG
jgi:ABC-type uncharacterized transport system permease subunit